MDKLLSGRRVLVVEDEMMVLMMIEDMLADLGCEAVVVAATTDQAIDLINTQVFDAAMLDMNLNGTKNSSIADALAAHGVPFIFSTGYSGHNFRAVTANHHRQTGAFVYEREKSLNSSLVSARISPSIQAI